MDEETKQMLARLETLIVLFYSIPSPIKCFKYKYLVLKYGDEFIETKLKIRDLRQKIILHNLKILCGY
jgi:hypothetical protein